MTTHVPTLVVGAGISGLVCVYALRKAGIEAGVVESSDVPGGVIHSERRDDYLLEFGPQSFNATPALLNLCRELHIDDQLVQAPANAPRYVLVNGTVRPVPLSPPAFMASSLFSPNSICFNWSGVRMVNLTWILTSSFCIFGIGKHYHVHV